VEVLGQQASRDDPIACKAVYPEQGHVPQFVMYQQPAEAPTEAFPMVLATGRVLEHFHTGSIICRSRVLELLELESHLDINPKVRNRLVLKKVNRFLSGRAEE